MEIAASATATLTLPIVKKLIEEIWKLLKQKRPSEKDLNELRKKITELINLSNNTGLALGRYIRLLKYSTEASVHSTELQSVLEDMPPKEIAKRQFTKLRDVRMETNLCKEGIEGIHAYRRDYEKAKEHYEKAKLHLSNAQKNFDSNNTSCIQEMDYLNDELDRLVIMVKRKLDELIEALREAYKVLERIE